MTPWVSAVSTALWQNALAVVPLALAVAVANRLLVRRPATRHTLWLALLLCFVAPALLPTIAPSRWLPTVRGGLTELVSQGRAVGATVAARVADVIRPMATRDVPNRTETDVPVAPLIERSAPHATVAEAQVPDSRFAWRLTLPDVPRLRAAEPFVALGERTPPRAAVSRPRTPTSSGGSANRIPDDSATGAESNESARGPLASTDRSAPVLAAAPAVVLPEAAPRRPNSSEARPPARPAAGGGPVVAERRAVGVAALPAVAADLSADGAAPARATAEFAAECAPEPDLSPAPAVAPVIPPPPRAVDWWSRAHESARVWLGSLGAVRDALVAVPALPGEIWAAGVFGLLLFTLAGVARFGRRLRRASPAPREVQLLVERLAQRFGLRHAPQTLMLDARVSPLIWCGRRARLVLPRGLWEQLDSTGRRAIVCHELAHLRRGDHWTCWIKQVVCGLFWWHPLAWWVRRRLDEEAEFCCDAWVTWLMPEGRRAYAQALLAAKQYTQAEPHAASAIGMAVMTLRAKQFARRIKMVMTQRTQPGLSLPGSTLAIALVLAGWLSGPAWSSDGRGSPRARAVEAPPAAIAEESSFALNAEIARLQAEIARLSAELAHTAVATPTPPPGVGALHDRLSETQSRLHNLSALHPIHAVAPPAPPAWPAVRGPVAGAPAPAPMPVARVAPLLPPTTMPPTAPLPPGAPAAALRPMIAYGQGPASGSGPVIAQATPRGERAPRAAASGGDARFYPLPPEKAEMLGALLAREDVPVQVRVRPDGIELHGTSEQQEIFGAFCDVVRHGWEERTYELPEEKGEALWNFMARQDVPIRVSHCKCGCGLGITAEATAPQHEVFRRFVEMIHPGAKWRPGSGGDETDHAAEAHAQDAARRALERAHAAEGRARQRAEEAQRRALERQAESEAQQERAIARALDAESKTRREAESRERRRTGQSEENTGLTRAGLGREKAESLGALLIRDDVPVPVRVEDDGISLHGTSEQNEAVARFIALVTPDELRETGGEIARTYRLPPEKLELLWSFMARDDVPVRVSRDDDGIAMQATAAQHEVIAAFIRAIHPDGEAPRRPRAGAGAGGSAPAAVQRQVAKALEQAAKARGKTAVPREAARQVEVQIRALEQALEQLGEQLEEAGEAAGRRIEGEMKKLEKSLRQLEDKHREFERKAEQAAERAAEEAEQAEEDEADEPAVSPDLDDSARSAAPDLDLRFAFETDPADAVWLPDDELNLNDMEADAGLAAAPPLHEVFAEIVAHFEANAPEPLGALLHRVAEQLTGSAVDSDEDSSVEGSAE